MATKKKKKLKPVTSHYSGNSSQGFWDIVNSIENESDKQELYSLGVALQNMESYVLRQLKNVKKSYVSNKMI